jgi:hypothetical protein
MATTSYSVEFLNLTSKAKCTLSSKNTKYSDQSINHELLLAVEHFLPGSSVPTLLVPEGFQHNSRSYHLLLEYVVAVQVPLASGFPTS